MGCDGFLKISFKLLYFRQDLAVLMLGWYKSLALFIHQSGNSIGNQKKFKNLLDIIAAENDTESLPFKVSLVRINFQKFLGQLLIHFYVKRFLIKGGYLLLIFVIHFDSKLHYYTNRNSTRKYFKMHSTETVFSVPYFIIWSFMEFFLRVSFLDIQRLSLSIGPRDKASFHHRTMYLIIFK